MLIDNPSYMEFIGWIFTIWVSYAYGVSSQNRKSSLKFLKSIDCVIKLKVINKAVDVYAQTNAINIIKF